ncbi:DUF3168 domain-containing protein [Streptomyces sp. NPDC048389]|uniref:DUF3168 domain-containing protein n=1 Tax=Streptomyces sp. NPDC048389 TaxID=3154622 RepID=UPI00345141C3
MSTPTPGTAIPAVQVAVHGALTGDAVLMDLITGVFDHLPEDQAYPYVVIGEATESPDNAHDRHGNQTTVTLHVWSQYRGYTQALTIAARIIQVLDHTALSIAGHRHVVTRYESSQTLTDPEPPGDIRHVPMRFRIVSEVDPA